MSDSEQRLQITLDRLPFGDEDAEKDIKVTGKLPKEVKSGELYKDVVNIAWPSFVELLLTQLVSMVDLMMVGKIGGTTNPQLGVQALSAVGLTTQPKFLLMTAFIAMNTGVTALVARNKGNGRIYGVYGRRDNRVSYAVSSDSACRICYNGTHICGDGIPSCGW